MSQEGRRTVEKVLENTVRDNISLATTEVGQLFQNLLEVNSRIRVVHQEKYACVETCSEVFLR